MADNIQIDINDTKYVLAPKVPPSKVTPGSAIIEILSKQRQDIDNQNTDLQNEVVRATQAEHNLQDQLGNQVVSLTELINAETVRATGAEQDLQQQIINETSARQIALNLKEDKSNKGVAGGYAGLDSNTKLLLANMPDFILNQMLYAGTVNTNTAVATLTTNAQIKLGTANTILTLTNNAVALTGYLANQGNFYIVSTVGTFAGITFDVGDWLVATAAGWGKIDNTDALKGIKGDKEVAYRIGYVNMTTTDIGAEPTITPGAITDYWAGNKTWRNLITDILAAAITGPTLTNSAIATGDSIQISLGKLQAQVTAAKSNADGREPVITGAATTITSTNLSVSRALISDVSGKVAVSATTATELGYVSGVTSNIQTQLNSKIPYATVNGVDMNTVKEPGFYYGYTQTNSAVSTISTFIVLKYSPDWVVQIQCVPNSTNDMYIRSYHTGTTWSVWERVARTPANLISNRALVSEENGKINASAITSTELSYISGVTSAIQTQLNGKSAATHYHTFLLGTNYTAGGGNNPPTWFRDNIGNGMTYRMIGSTYSGNLGASYNDCIFVNAYESDITGSNMIVMGKSGVGRLALAYSANKDATAWNVREIFTTGSTIPVLNGGTGKTVAGNIADMNGDWEVSKYLRWKNYGNGHVIIDASNGTAPNGAAINNKTPDNAWSASYPTLMGWNGAQTYGVRTYISNVADNANALGGLALSTGLNNVANQVARTDASGYFQCGYINTNVGIENPAIGSFFVQNTSADGYIRKASLAHVVSSLSSSFQSIMLAENAFDGLSAPSVYPMGQSIFFSNNPINKFNGVLYCTIVTIKGYPSNFFGVVQYIYPYNVDAPIYYRYGITNTPTTGSWTAWRAIQTEIPMGTTAQYYRGDKTMQDFATAVRAAGITAIGTSSTAAATQAKTVTITNYVRFTGAIIGVRFTLGNTHATPTLNVNSTGAANIRYKNGNITANMIPANMIALFQFDGTNWELLNPSVAGALTWKQLKGG